MSFGNKNNNFGKSKKAIGNNCILVKIPHLTKKISLPYALDEFVSDFILRIETSLNETKLNFGLFAKNPTTNVGYFLKDRELLCDAFKSISKVIFREKRRIFNNDILPVKLINEINSQENQKLFLKLIIRNEMKSILELLSKQFDPNYLINNEPLLFHAINNENSVILVAILVCHGAHIDLKSSTGVTCMHKAVRANKPDVLKFFIQLGLSTDYLDNKGLSPLYYCTLYNRDSHCMSILLDNDAMIGCTDSAGLSELHQASINNQTDLIHLLISHGVDINFPTENNNDTPLHSAVMSHSVDAIKFLLEHGANPHLRNDKRLSCLDLVEDNFPDLIELFRHQSDANENQSSYSSLQRSFIKRNIGYKENQSNNPAQPNEQYYPENDDNDQKINKIHQLDNIQFRHNEIKTNPNCSVTHDTTELNNTKLTHKIQNNVKNDQKIERMIGANEEWSCNSNQADEIDQIINSETIKLSSSKPVANDNKGSEATLNQRCSPQEIPDNADQHNKSVSLSSTTSASLWNLSIEYDNINPPVCPNHHHNDQHQHLHHQSSATSVVLQPLLPSSPRSSQSSPSSQDRPPSQLTLIHCRDITTLIDPLAYLPSKIVEFNRSPTGFGFSLETIITDQKDLDKYRPSFDKPSIHRICKWKVLSSMMMLYNKPYLIEVNGIPVNRMPYTQLTNIIKKIPQKISLKIIQPQVNSLSSCDVEFAVSERENIRTDELSSQVTSCRLDKQLQTEYDAFSTYESPLKMMPLTSCRSTNQMTPNTSRLTNQQLDMLVDNYNKQHLDPLTTNNNVANGCSGCCTTTTAGSSTIATTQLPMTTQNPYSNNTLTTTISSTLDAPKDFSGYYGDYHVVTKRKSMHTYAEPFSGYTEYKPNIATVTRHLTTAHNSHAPITISTTTTNKHNNCQQSKKTTSNFPEFMNNQHQMDNKFNNVICNNKTSISNNTTRINTMTKSYPLESNCGISQKSQINVPLFSNQNTSLCGYHRTAIMIPLYNTVASQNTIQLK